MCVPLRPREFEGTRKNRKEGVTGSVSGTQKSGDGRRDYYKKVKPFVLNPGV